MVFNAEAEVHTAMINSTHISVSADKRIKADLISNVIVMMFPNIVLWMVQPWLCGALAVMLAGLHVFVLRSFIKINKAHTNFNKALTKTCQGLIEILLSIDFRYHGK